MSFPSIDSASVNYKLRDSDVEKSQSVITEPIATTPGDDKLDNQLELLRLCLHTISSILQESRSQLRLV
jgi:hypothetical protein